LQFGAFTEELIEHIKENKIPLNLEEIKQM